MRQHVNPLSRFFQIANELPRYEELFENISLPIHLDIGSARGKFLIGMAAENNQSNYLGLEIRKPLVQAAEKERIQLELNNLKFLFCNANVSLGNWLKNLQGNPVNTVSIQFPDPWFKNRHKKRRLLDSHLTSLIAINLKKGSRLFLQTDVQSVMDDMISNVEASRCFYIKDSDLNLLSNPFKLSTEREIYAIKKGLKIYRRIYTRNKNSVMIQ